MSKGKQPRLLVKALKKILSGKGGGVTMTTRKFA